MKAVALLGNRQHCILFRFAAALALPLAVSAASASMNFEYTWEYSVNGKPVSHSEPYSNNGETGFINEGVTEVFLEPSFPGSAQGAVYVRGTVLPRQRNFGVGVQAVAWINAFNPKNQSPQMANTEVSAHISYRDTVIAFSPSIKLGSPIAIKVQPALFNGSMGVPDPKGSAIGNASLRIWLSTAEFGVFSDYPPFERNLPNGKQFSFEGNQIRSEKLFPMVEVRNGSLTSIVFDMLGTFKQTTPKSHRIY